MTTDKEIIEAIAQGIHEDEWGIGTWAEAGHITKSFARTRAKGAITAAEQVSLGPPSPPTRTGTMATNKEIKSDPLKGLLAWAQAAVAGKMYAPAPEDIVRAFAAAKQAHNIELKEMATPEKLQRKLSLHAAIRNAE